MSAHQEALWVGNNVCVCHSFHSVTPQLQLGGRRQAPFNSDGLEELDEGGGSGHRVVIFTHCHTVLPAPCAAVASLSPAALLEPPSLMEGDAIVFRSCILWILDNKRLTIDLLFQEK